MGTNRWAVITGGSSGIGAAIFRRLVQREGDLNCLAIGRRPSNLEDARRRAIADDDDSSDCKAEHDCDGGSVVGGRVRVVSADVGTPGGVSAVVAALPADASVKYLVHNAGTLGPIAPLTDVDRAAWDEVVDTNLGAPLFLTQALLPHLKRCAERDGDKSKARVLHVSSGAAHSSYVGWGPYCVTKAGLHMMYRCLSGELSRHGVLVGSVRPGVVDTPMQVEIREYDGPAEDFPMKTKFDALRDDGKLIPPDIVATYLHWLLSEVGDDEFVEKEWDLRESGEDERWKDYSSS